VFNLQIDAPRLDWGSYRSKFPQTSPGKGVQSAIQVWGNELGVGCPQSFFVNFWIDLMPQGRGKRTTGDDVKERVRFVVKLLLGYVVKEEDLAKVKWHSNKKVELWIKLEILRSLAKSEINQINEPALKRRYEDLLGTLGAGREDAETSRRRIGEALSQYILKDGLLLDLQDLRSERDKRIGRWGLTFSVWHDYEDGNLDAFLNQNLSEFDCLWEKLTPAKQQAISKASDPETPPTPPPNNLPAGIRDSQQFVGREQELEQLDQIFKSRGQVAIAAVAGMGGLGKTELAIQYARGYAHNYPRGVLWLGAGAEQDLATQVKTLTLEYRQFTANPDLPLERQVQQCWREWLVASPAGKMLVILDDVADYSQIKPYLPQNLEAIQLLLTTRLTLGPDFAELDLGVLQPLAALKLLRVLVGAERVEPQLAEAERLCTWMGYLPLGLELVGRYLALEPRLLIAQVLTELEMRGLQHDSLQADPAQTRSSTAERGVAAAFALSWQKLDQAARRLGAMLSLFAAAPIPWAFVEAAEQERCTTAEAEFSRQTLERARRDLLRLHLLQGVDDNTYRQHQLIRQFCRDMLELSTNATA
jgi:NB-ARC domain